MSSKIKKPNNISGKAWSGVWRDNYLGWRLSEYIHLFGNSPNTGLKGFSEPQTVYRVKVTVELITDKKGRPITRRIMPSTIN